MMFFFLQMFERKIIYLLFYFFFDVLHLTIEENPNWFYLFSGGFIDSW